MNDQRLSVEMKDVHLTLQGAAGPVNILRGVSLAAAPGETLSIVGPSGSGKTTMLMVMAGLERPTSGSVRLDGEELGTRNEDELARIRRGRVGIVFQGFHLVPTMTALENAALPLEFAGHDQPFERARECLDLVGLADRAMHYPSQLSGGEQQRVAIARAFGPAPALLLADEPTGNLDQETGARVVDMLFRLRNEHDSTLMLITHDQSLAARCERNLTMRDGMLHEERG